MSDQTGAPPISAEQIREYSDRVIHDDAVRAVMALVIQNTQYEHQLAALTEERERLREALKVISTAARVDE